MTVTMKPADMVELAGELVIRVRQEGWVWYEGSRAQIESEGLLPPDFTWPNPGESAQWTVGALAYWLDQFRPVGFKGPRRAALALDSWRLRVHMNTGRDALWHQRRAAQLKIQALESELRSLTEAGRAEQQRQIARYCAAQLDKGFQAFKSSLPGGRRNQAATAPCGIKTVR